jgi:Cdc6-like AAA superfamily ATPase
MNTRKRSAQGDLTLRSSERIRKMTNSKEKKLLRQPRSKSQSKSRVNSALNSKSKITSLNLIPKSKSKSRSKNLLIDFHESDEDYQNESDDEEYNHSSVNKSFDLESESLETTSKLSKINKKKYIDSVLKNKVKPKRTISEVESDLEEEVVDLKFRPNKSKSKPRVRTKSSKRNQVTDNEEDDLPSEIPFLPCREKEQETIYNYVKKGLETSGSYTGLYISGMPGTGKTACVTTIINKLRRESKQKLVPCFKVLELNGMKITNPNSVFKQIYDNIFDDGRSTSMKKCMSLLDNFFKNRRDFNCKTELRDINNSHIILIIDEIDCLINKKQLLLYNIFNWTTYPQSKLIIISISNTLDLPEKLMPKISSRMGNNRLCFKPYQRDELVKILSVKIDSFELFSEDAVKLSAMKVAAVNGDLRRILQICRRAKEIFDSTSHGRNEKIDKIHILKATEELFDSKVQKAIANLQIYEKFVLCAILHQMKLDLNNKVSVELVYNRFQYFYQQYYRINCPITFQEYMLMIYNLVKMQMIIFSDNCSTNFINNFLTIKFYADEFTIAVNKDAKFSELISDLA